MRVRALVAGVAHYMPLADLPAAQARELVQVKVVAPTMLMRAAVAGMTARGDGTIINVAGMIAFSGPAPHSQMPRRAVYTGTLAHLVVMSPLTTWSPRVCVASNSARSCAPLVWMMPT